MTSMAETIHNATEKVNAERMAACASGIWKHHTIHDTTGNNPVTIAGTRLPNSNARKTDHACRTIVKRTNAGKPKP